MVTKTRTVGVDPKLPIQAVGAVVAFLASYFGLELDSEVSLAIATVLGFVAGYFGPVAKTTSTKDQVGLK